MDKKIHNSLLGNGQRRSLIREFKQNNSELDLQSAKLAAFSAKWLAISTKSPRYERRLYKQFVSELMGVLAIEEFDGSKGKFDFERGHTRRPHDTVVGKIVVEDQGSIFTTSIEVKPPNWNMDLDRNERNETILEQAINVSHGNPFTRQLITTNFKSFRIYLPNYGYEYFEQFGLDKLLVDDESRALFLSLLSPELLVEHEINNYRTFLYSLVDSSLTEKKKKIDLLYELYIDALNKTTRDITSQNLVADPVLARQSATQFINRFMFVEYAYQAGLHDAPLNDMLSAYESKKLSTLFDVMDKGGKFQGKEIPKFNGGLFQSDVILNRIIPNKKTFEKIRELTEIQLSDMAPEVLGRIFEKSLSVGLSELPNSPTESDSLGAVYTPAYLASAMAKLCFSLVGEDTPKILDPSCGSGVFVLESLKLMLGKAEHRNGRQIEKFLKSNIAGWDINPAAVEITRFMIWQHVANLDLPLPAINNNIHVGDALLDRLEKANQQPNIIIGNPPFIAHQNLRRSYKDQMEKRFLKTLDPAQQYDICVAFFERALEVVSDDGVVAFVSPNQLSFRPYGEKLRDFILEKNEVERVVDLTQIKVFDKSICPFVYVLRKGQTKKKPKSFNIYTDITKFSSVVDAFELLPVQTNFTSLRHDKDLEFLARGFADTGVAKLDKWRPDEYARKHKRKILSILIEKPHRGKVNKGTGSMKVKVITSKFENGQPIIAKLGVSALESTRLKNRFGKDKIVFPRFFQSQMISAKYGKDFYVGDNVYYLTQEDLKADIKEDLEFLNCLINSRFYSLIDYLRSGLDRINHFGFRAMDGEKFADLFLPETTNDRIKKIKSLFKKSAKLLNITNSSKALNSKGRAQRSRIDKIVDFELEIASLLDFNLTSSEMLTVLKWWSKKREGFLEAHESDAAS